MALLTRRNGEVRKTLGSYLAPAASYSVTAYEPGGVASSISTGTTITMAAGHGFAAADKILINPGSANTFSGSDTVQSVTATTIVMGSSYTIAVGDVIFNLGADTGASAPAFDGSGLTIYSDPAGATAITNETVTTNSEGEYGYWTRAHEVWELIRSGSSVLDCVIDAVRTVDQSIRYAHTYATSGSGSSSSPWAGWESSVTGAPAGGCVVAFVPGFFEVSSAIAIPDGVSMIGSGHEPSTTVVVGTVLRPASGYSDDYLLYDAPDAQSVGRGRTVKDMTLLGSVTGTTPAIDWAIHSNNSDGTLYENLSIQFFLRGAIKAYGGGNVVTMRKIWTLNCCEDAGLAANTAVIWINGSSEFHLSDMWLHAGASDYSESGKRIGLLIDNASSGGTCVGVWSHYCERGLVMTGSSTKFTFIGGGSTSTGNGADIESNSNAFIGYLCNDTGTQTTNTYDAFNVTGGNNVFIGCRVQATAVNKVRYGFRSVNNGSFVNLFVGCISPSGTCATATFISDGSAPGYDLWLGDNLAQSGSARAAIGSPTLVIGRNVDGVVQITFDGNTADGTIQYRLDQPAGVTRRFIFNDNIQADGLHSSADPGGMASTVTITHTTDTPTTDPGWATSSTVNMTAPNGYIKMYVGTQAVTVPYWVT